jgi:hypothetical protein
MTVGKDLEGSGMAKFKVLSLSRFLPGGTDENHEKLSKNSRSLGRDLNSGPSEYEVEMLTTRPRRFVRMIYLWRLNQEQLDGRNM